MIMAAECDSDDNSEPLEQVFVESDAGIFSFDGYQLKFQDHPYAKDVAQYVPLLEPLRPKKGTIAARQLRHYNKPRSWWQSQCVFRGLLIPDGTTEEFQKALRGHEEDPMSIEILEVLDRAKALLAAKNKEKEKHWLYDMSDDEKAMKDPRRFLKEEFPAGSDKEKTVLLTTPFVANIQDTAEQLDLGCKYTFAPTDGDAVVRMAKYWVVVGQDRKKVTEEIRMIERQTQRLKREQEEGRQELRRKNKLIRERQMETEEAVAKSKDWDVTGLWNISCPHIEERLDVVGNLTMKIYVEKTEKGSLMLAEFDFGVLSGILRFERQQDDAILPLKQPTRQQDTVLEDNVEDDDKLDEKQKGALNDDENSEQWSDTYDEHEGDDDDDQDDHESNYQRSSTPEDFYFKFISQPSAIYPTWNYHHRTEVTGGVLVNEGLDVHRNSVTFYGPNGGLLKGDFGSNAFGVCTFTGVKVGAGGSEHVDRRKDWGKWIDRRSLTPAT